MNKEELYYLIQNELVKIRNISKDSNTDLEKLYERLRRVRFLSDKEDILIDEEIGCEP